MKISKEKFGQSLDALSSDYQLIAPVSETGGVNFKAVKSFADIKQDYLNSKLPPKAIFFPQHEKLLSYVKNGKDVTVKNELKVGKTIIFGMRPCDAKGLLLLDKVFTNDQYQDPYYYERRDNTVIIGVACNKIAPTCFCSSLGLSPAGSEGADIFLIDLGDAYAVEVITEKGKALFTDLQLSDLTAQEQALVDAVKSAQTAGQVDVSTITGKLDKMFNNAYWDSLQEKCLGCNTCSFSCPTCHCFDISEEVRQNAGSRVRTWDACMAPLFTLHGSGHNPRNTQKERWRQRMMHKFNYFVHNNGDMACVGCGRCIRSCPVNMDMRQVIDGVNKAELVVE
ncbi:4Fe-4S dicluster domain-containing protein [Desulfosporosinus sp. PR]|uniref:4Fe-4S dicluster domain-containing protein n=1 Tax=Candidatus Desulfosporosinus nitrosoreducens TaxID=3401928 RepID=UPI0027EFD5ED|nr:4Fe-4S dicluster domain-containing protein [Desulfosporosinus sp. PR]MDQ7093430.1 4Fe-4S dicluster domain-containing protein [Desulfosporosinus sp. PR]